MGRDSEKTYLILCNNGALHTCSSGLWPMQNGLFFRGCGGTTSRIEEARGVNGGRIDLLFWPRFSEYTGSSHLQRHFAYFAYNYFHKTSLLWSHLGKGHYFRWFSVKARHFNTSARSRTWKRQPSSFFRHKAYVQQWLWLILGIRSRWTLLYAYRQRCWKICTGVFRTHEFQGVPESWMTVLIFTCDRLCLCSHASPGTRECLSWPSVRSTSHVDCACSGYDV
jgi:hypothetical protein